ncbi:MAG: MFS transporter [Ferruginibacter sp.]
MIASTLRLYKNAYDGLTRRIWLLSAVMLINRSGTMVLPFMTLYCTHLGFSVKQAGLVVAVYGLGSMFGALLGGRLSDKFGFYYTQVGALFFGGLLFLLLGQMQSLQSICFCTFFLSMVNESFRPANATAVTHYSTPQNRTQSFSLIRLAMNIGWGVGSALGGLLASIDYHLLFWVDGFTNIVAAIILWMVLPKVSLSQQKQVYKTEEVTVITSPYRDKIFMQFCLFTFLFAFCFFQLFTTVPLYFKTHLYLDEFLIGIVMAVNGILIALFEMVIVFKLEGSRPYLRLIFYGTLIMGFSFLFLDFPFAAGLVLASLFIFFITIAEIVAMPFMNSFYISLTRDHNRGQYAGMYVLSWSAAQVAGSSAGAFIAYRYGFNNLWVFIFSLTLVAAAGYFWLQKKIPDRPG